MNRDIKNFLVLETYKVVDHLLILLIPGPDDVAELAEVLERLDRFGILERVGTSLDELVEIDLVVRGLVDDLDFTPAAGIDAYGRAIEDIAIEIAIASV